MSTFVGEGRGDVTDRELDQWVLFVYEADAEHRDRPHGGVAPTVIAAEAATEHRHRTTVKRHLGADDRVDAATGIGPRGSRVVFVPAQESFEPVAGGEVADA